MFERFRREQPSLQLYGKLPLAKDYLRVGASKGTARTFREWLDAAFSARAIASAQPSVPWPARFVLGAAPGEPVVGSLWSSSDEGGERAFPFAMFVERRRRAVVESFGNGISGLVPVWAQLERCFARRDEHRGGESFLAAMRGQEIQVRDAVAAAVPRVAWGAWIRALFGDEGVEGLARVLTAVARGAPAMGPLRLPLVADLPILPQVHGWWTALVTLRVFGTGSLPDLVFPQEAEIEGAAAFCTFFAAPLTAADVVWLGPADGRSLGAGDHCDGAPRRVGDPIPVPESGSGLAESMRGVAAGVRARI
jgi:hypothetical protein